MSQWQRYTDLHPQHTVIGDLRVWQAHLSPQLGNSRDILVWLPPDYHTSERRYPVLYMHDAQNLFDAHTSYAGEWQVDETLSALHAEGYAAIVVGLPSGERPQRSAEYNPYPEPVTGWPQGRGTDYIAYLTATIKPLIDADFRTLAQASATGIMGSSMGGLISLFGFLSRPDVFGICGALSTAYWFGGEGLLNTIAERANGHGRIYMDVGTREGLTLGNWDLLPLDPDAEYVAGVRRLRDALVAHGYHAGNLVYVEEEGAIHQEGAWARRLPDALRFLLAEWRA